MGMKFKVLAGQHIMNHPAGLKKEDGRPVEVVCRPGDIIESDVDLVQKFNQEGSEKFQRVFDNQQYIPQEQDNPVAAAARAGADPRVSNTGQTTPPLPPKQHSDGLDAMTIEDLRGIAKKNGVDINRIRDNKSAMIAAIRANTE